VGVNPQGFVLNKNRRIRRIVFWLPGANDLRTIPIEYDRSVYIKVKQPEKTRHVIHKAVEWKKMLDCGETRSLSEVARTKGLTRARVTQIMNLLKLPADLQEFLVKLDDPKEIRKFSERKLRNKQKVKFNSKHKKNEH
jgi:hypothetical protein